jgi:hypothetical protein
MKRTKMFRHSRASIPTNAKLDTYKLVFDLMKHLTTLSSGSILILITLLEKVFQSAPPSITVGVAFTGFCFSIVLAIVAMLLLAMNASDGRLTEGERNVFAVAATFSAVSFGLGICFVAFAALPSFVSLR